LHIKPHLGDIQLTRLTGTRISALYRDLERSGRQDHESGTGLSAKTVRYIHTILRAAFAEAVRQGLIVSNPVDRAHPPAAREARRPEIYAWQPTQLAAFLAWANEHGCSDAVAYRVLAYTGMRRGEALALRWRDFAADAGRLSVRRSVGVVRTKVRASSWSKAQLNPARSGSSILIRRRLLRYGPGEWLELVLIFGWPATTR
jgi:integrase